MSAADIIMHWRQFVQDVSEELLLSDERMEQQRLEAVDMLGLEVMSAQQGSGCQAQPQETDASDDSGNFTFSKTCRWCGCTNSEGLHLEGGCSTGEELEAQQQQGQRQQQDVAQLQAAAAAAAAAGGSDTDAKLMALVSKYSYMTKFVALLNPGVLGSKPEVQANKQQAIMWSVTEQPTTMNPAYLRIYQTGPE
jgi:hypothetical protein